MTLAAHIEVDRPAWSLEIDLHVEPGEVLALMGPNGAGKSTTLAAVAGTQPLSRGEVRLGNRVLERSTGQPGTGSPPHERRIGMVFQEARLFPHLDALANIAFGPRARGEARQDARATAAEWLERVGLADRARAAPDELSGGEAQRVALARVLATDPEALLLDEPFAAADPKARSDLRALVSATIEDSGLPTIVVTQDLVDAAVMADRILILESGRVTQEGDLRDITRHPRSPWAAELVGVNLLRGRGHAEVVELAGGARFVTVDPPQGDCFLAVHPTAVALYPRRPEGTPRNVWELRVGEIEQFGGRVRIGLEGEVELVAEVTPSAVSELELGTGRVVWAAIKATEVVTYAV